MKKILLTSLMFMASYGFVMAQNVKIKRQRTVKTQTERMAEHNSHVIAQKQARKTAITNPNSRDALKAEVAPARNEKKARGVRN